MHFGMRVARREEQGQVTHSPTVVQRVNLISLQLLGRQPGKVGGFVDFVDLLVSGFSLVDEDAALGGGMHCLQVDPVVRLLLLVQGFESLQELLEVLGDELVREGEPLTQLLEGERVAVLHHQIVLILQADSAVDF